MHFLCRFRLGGAVFAFLFFAPYVHAAGPQLSAQSLSYDFGEVLQGEMIERTFEFRNTGEEDLRIENVRSSCGCTAVLVSSRLLAPGEGGSVKMIFNSRDFQGQVVKTATLTTSDPLRPKVSLELRGKVRPWLLLSPPQVNLGVLQSGQQHLLRITLTNQGSRDLTLTQVRSTIKGIAAELSPHRLPPGGKGEILIRTRLEKEGRVSGVIVLNMEGGTLPVLRIPVGGFISSSD